MIFGAIVLLTVIFSKISSSYDCNEKYLAFSQQHTMCKKPNAQCKVVGKGVTKEEKDLIVEVHNLLRCKLATGKEKDSVVMPAAANMLEMEWDDELASIAQKHAETCSFEHDCKDCRRVERFHVGQNMALRTNTTLKKDFKKTILDFYDEIKVFDKSLISAFRITPSFKRKKYGHFTQIIWSESWKVGCGYVEHKEGEQITGLLICNYGPRMKWAGCQANCAQMLLRLQRSQMDALQMSSFVVVAQLCDNCRIRNVSCSGNIVGKQMYKEGDPCSSCPKNSCCKEKCESFNVTAKYCGLCKMVS